MPAKSDVQHFLYPFVHILSPGVAKAIQILELKTSDADHGIEIRNYILYEYDATQQLNINKLEFLGIIFISDTTLTHGNCESMK